ncbi:MAG: hypothetical protein JST54_12080 [Deltaproteobacteria bacterium]|nr:hypothetical protein [Deltaproteobacteria bacterium]
MVHVLAVVLLATPISDVPTGWVVLSAPPAGDQLTCAGYSEREWKVAWTDGGVRITPDDGQQSRSDSEPFPIKGTAEEGLAGERHVLGVQDGYLIGFDAGEFGGALWWASKDGSRRERLRTPGETTYDVENVHGMASMGDDVLVIQGLAHLSINVGKAVLVSTTGHRIRFLADLNAEPLFVFREDDRSAIVLTNRRLIRLHPSGAIEVLAQLEVLDSALYPNSMVRSPSGVFWVGMRHLVLRLAPRGSGYESTWFAPKDCANWKVRGTDCVCGDTRSHK